MAMNKEFSAGEESTAQKHVTTYRPPRDVLAVIHMIEKNGHQAYVVGGVCRSLRYISTNDADDLVFDLVTTASKEEIVKIFGERDCVLSKKGISYRSGRFTVIIEQLVDTDGNPTKSIEEDAKRRDFTVNALYMNSDSVIYDPTGLGLKHLNSRSIHFIGNPVESIMKDPVRLIRYLRFSGQKSFSGGENIEEVVIWKVMERVSEIPVAEFREEFLKSLGQAYDTGRILEDMRRTGVLELFLPELNKCWNFNQRVPEQKYFLHKHLIKTMEYLKEQLSIHGWKNEDILLAALLHGIGKPESAVYGKYGEVSYEGLKNKTLHMVNRILERLEFSMSSKEYILGLIEHNYKLHEPHTLRLFLEIGGRENSNFTDTDLILLYMSDLKACSDRGQSTYLSRFFNFPRIEVTFTDWDIREFLRYHCFEINDEDINNIRRIVKEYYMEKPNISHEEIEKKLSEVFW
jgi:tRNA nucleotidyltransferase (CCA-adding enzyme)